jgi:ubiquinone/menaquinone biosynthesis C-methylase UbiE
VGRDFAASLGYPPELLASLPALCVEAFAGVSNVSVFAEIPRNARVLDLGCGAGLDTLITARRVGPRGRVISVDFSEEMLARARHGTTEAGEKNIILCRGDAERLPIQDGAVDVALVNGIFNLNPAREEIFCELARVVRVGGRVFAAELVLREPLPPTTVFSESDWFA